MRKTILDLKMKVITSEPEGVYITPADSKYTIPELWKNSSTLFSVSSALLVTLN